MAITNRPKPKTEPAPQPADAAVDAFISGAPDAPKPRGVKKGNRQQISLTIAPTLLEKIDALRMRFLCTNGHIHESMKQIVNNALKNR